MSSAFQRIVSGSSIAWQWARFSARTAGYASVSCMFGPWPNGRVVCQELFRRWCQASVAQMGIQVTASGSNAVNDVRPAVLVANHLSSLDIPVLGTVLRGDYRWVAKRELFRIPFVGWHLSLAGHIPVNRGGGRRSHEDLDQRFRRVFSEGGSILLFPEGTRSPDGGLQAFKLGAFFASVTHGVPVIPLVLNGTEQIAKKGALTLDPSASRQVQVRVLEPLEPPAEGSRDERAKRLREGVRAAVVDALDDLRGGSGAAERPTLSATTRGTSL